LEKYIVKGETRLCGEVSISGAKNAAVAILPATVLCPGCNIIDNVPDISDVHILFKILQNMGAQVMQIGANAYQIDTTHIDSSVVSYEYARAMRASYYFIGALLGRCQQASVSMPGGCHLGPRPIDQHIKGFEALGAQIAIDGGMVNASADKLTGAHIHFDVVSVGATVNAMLASVRGKGVTVLENAAKEPHIVDLANFLNSMGADVRGAGTDTVKIHGVDMLHGTSYTIIPDQIEAGSYMAMATATGGDVLIKNVIPKHLESITDKLSAAGAVVDEYDDMLRIRRPGAIEKLNLKTMPHPGFPTDMQPQMTAMLTMANGTSIVTEGIWDGRFRYVDELKRMGANIQVDGKMAVIEGGAPLTGAPVSATDLRAGMALIIAGFMAKGVTEIEDIEHVERGYENIVQKITSLGGEIEKTTLPDSVYAKAL
jgi:UDP-N-acetylglucosamine 1-carboxyvinyltransferase